LPGRKQQCCPPTLPECNWSGLFVFAVIAGLSRLAGIAMVRASGDLAL
jgi:hypothetical protein